MFAKESCQYRTGHHRLPCEVCIASSDDLRVRETASPRARESGTDAGGSPMGSEPHEGAKKASMAGSSEDCPTPRRRAEWHTSTAEVAPDFLHNFLQFPV